MRHLKSYLGWQKLQQKSQHPKIQFVHCSTQKYGKGLTPTMLRLAIPTARYLNKSSLNSLSFYVTKDFCQFLTAAFHTASAVNLRTSQHTCISHGLRKVTATSVTVHRFELQQKNATTLPLNILIIYCIKNQPAIKNQPKTGLNFHFWPKTETKTGRKRK